jgi:hypothetical protein
MHNNKKISNFKVNKLIKLKLNKIIDIMNNTPVKIIALNEWGNVYFDRGELSSNINSNKAFSRIYGYEAFRKKGISVCTIRQYMGVQPALNITEGVKNCEWIFYTGESGKILLFKQSIIKKVNGSRDIQLPIHINDHNYETKELLLKLKFKNNKHKKSNIFTSIIPLRLSSNDILYITVLHDTALGAYHGKHYNKDRWLYRNETILDWFKSYLCKSYN